MIRVVAEAGQCHNGSVQTAIDLAWNAHHHGAWAIKYQLLKPDTIAAPNAPKYWTDDFGTANQREAFAKAGIIDYGAWREVKDACDDFHIEFLATPFDLEAVDVLADMGVRFWKVASGDLTYRRLIERIAQTGGTIILSTGAAYQLEIARALQWTRGCPVILLACTLSYPTGVDDAHVSRVQALHHTFPWCEVGYSDHTSLPETGMVAAALGSTLNEVHFTLDNSAPDVPDHAMAVDPNRLAEYVQASELGARLAGDPSLIPCDAEQAARKGARRGMYAVRDLPAGHVVTADDLVALRPETTIPPFCDDQLVGRRIESAVKAGEPIER